jgi:GR25 family glycosyltransferase involved in LPS biosynthesis
MEKKYIENILLNYKICIDDIKNDLKNINYINKFKIYIINLRSNIYRRNYIKKLMQKMNIDYYLIIVEEIPKELYDEIVNKTKIKMRIGELGCCLSHLWCLNNAISLNLDQFIIFEDDIIFHKNFYNKLQNILNQNIKYDLIMMGACDFNIKHNIKSYDKKLETYKPYKNALGAHANLYSLKFAKLFYQSKLKKLTSYDFDYINFYNNSDLNICICYPNLVVCELSSTNLNHNFSFNDNIKENMYYNNCFIKFDFNDYNFIYIDILQKIVESKNEIIGKKMDYNEIINYILDNKYKSYIKLKIYNRICINFFTLEDILDIIHSVENDKYYNMVIT